MASDFRWKLATWNCFGAAQDASAFLQWRGAASGYRLQHPDLRTAIAGMSVVCIQEVWLSDVEEFFDGLPHRHKVRCRNESTLFPPTVGGSGLGIASRLPIVQSSQRLFLGPKVHAERAARKGMLHARVRVCEGVEVDVVTTHMQSGYSGGAVQVRAGQLGELSRFVDEVNRGERDVFICGDLNLCGKAAGRSNEYQSLAKHFGDFQDLFAESDESTFCPHPEQNSLAYRFEPKAPVQRLDYVLFRAGVPSCTRIAEKRMCFTDKLPASAAGPAVEPSDHAGLLVTLLSR